MYAKEEILTTWKDGEAFSDNLFDICEEIRIPHKWRQPLYDHSIEVMRETLKKGVCYRFICYSEKDIEIHTFYIADTDTPSAMEWGRKINTAGMYIYTLHAPTDNEQPE